MESERYKLCFKCGESKPLSHFYKHSEMADGHVNKCIECNKTDVRKNRAKNIGYYTEYDRQRGRDITSERVQKQRAKAKTPEAIAKNTILKRISADRYPHKKACRTKFGNAVRDGHLLRPECCEHCGKICRSQGHHSSYSLEMALMVTWLCTTCHGSIHRLS